MNAVLAYSQTARPQVSAPDVEALVLAHAPLVKRIAYHLLARLPASVQVDDLIQAGMIGLMEAARRYDDGQGASFETYAGIRIRGTILDELRRGGWLPRTALRKLRQITEATRAAEREAGGEASAEAIARQLGMSLDEYYTLAREASEFGVVRFSDLGSEDDEPWENGIADRGPGPQAQVEDDNLRARIADAVELLPEREKLVMSLYYEQELNLREIGEVLGVSESRVCQIHGQALLRLRTRLGGRD
ncbi:MAG TPA: RNA polymerase sigma factor FliA [Gammaproteobacteria bacterium]|uniref:RNA polymerase sigma factor FliA n=1 Tax=Immundisolibacter sp. TaxID=1934948 RepID=UPI000E9DAB62|nr:RNA polymerase sigma factor FliA [Gammaproteobacteria bacterium]HCZ49486.1 RNA polymerase sigma factor FliA [Gammaproteobacteria bacterium]MCH78924.1 RNA polymerase sigma factor FliA [Gammaproteobacteria bacterium]